MKVLMRSLLLVLALLPLADSPVQAQADPCGGGYDPLRDPRHPLARCFEEIGRMYGLIGKCSSNQAELYGMSIHPLGDVSGDSLADWIVAHQLCDSLVEASPRIPRELLLYKGVRGGLPVSASGERIGPSELGSSTEFLACGDWDGDGYRDIATRIQIYGDTSFGNNGRYGIATLTVFWGDGTGLFTITDTTRLSSGADAWAGPSSALSADLDQDGVDDLMAWDWEGAGMTNGQIVPVPKLQVFKGNRGRWGHGNTGRSAEWRWWEAPGGTLVPLDHDRDGLMDVVIYVNNGNRSSIAVLYGRAGMLPDTLSLQSVSLLPSDGRFSLFSDVTGDKVADLLVGSGRRDFVKVFVGLKGQRLLEQYGSGNDSAQPGSERWWGRPWATIWLPRRINPNWFGDDDNLYDLGDANQDGVGDIYAFSWPYLLEYNGGGNLDSLADAVHNITPAEFIKTAALLGDIDGTKKQTIAVAGSGIAFLRGSRLIPSSGVPRRLPEGTGMAAVPAHSGKPSPALLLNAIPNPSSGDISLLWRGDVCGSSAGLITVTDERGAETAQYNVESSSGRFLLSRHSLSQGYYLITFRCGDRTSTASIIVR